MTSSWFFLSTLNYDARSTTHQISVDVYCNVASLFVPHFLSFQTWSWGWNPPLCHCSILRTFTAGRGASEVGKLAQGIHWLAEGFGLLTRDKRRQALSLLQLYTVFHIGPDQLACTIKVLFVSHASNKHNSRTLRQNSKKSNKYPAEGSVPRETRNERLKLDSPHDVTVRAVWGAVRVKELESPDLMEADQSALVGRVCGGVSDRGTRVFPRA